MDSRRSHALGADEANEPGEVRRATILDVPAMVRALAPVETPQGVSATEMSRILRLTLTHVAIEHGMAWIEVNGSGDVIGTALAVPTWELDGGRELPELLAREAAIDAEPIAEHDALLGWVGALGKAWLVAHPVCREAGASGNLMRRLIAEAEASASADGVPLMLIATREADQLLARELGFAALDVLDAGSGIWIGAKHPVGRPDPVRV